MEPLYQHLLDEVFPRALAQDPNLVAKVAGFEGAVYFSGRDLVFTLPELFRFLLADFPSGPASDVPGLPRYPAFRRMLYRRPTNTLLAKMGAVVIVEKASGQHASTLYRLTARAP